MAADRPLTRIVMIGHAPATFPEAHRERFHKPRETRLR
jgi:hypothetical protein